jgi:DinB superfamily
MTSALKARWEDESPAELLADIDTEQARLRELLAGKDPAMLARRPSSGKWSVVENLRHLLFAEQGHLGSVNPGGVTEWNPLGLPSGGMQKHFPTMDSAATPEVGQILEAWQALHTSAGELIKIDSPEVRRALWINRRHLRTHIKVIESLLREHERQAKAAPSRGKRGDAREKAP